MGYFARRVCSEHEILHFILLIDGCVSSGSDDNCRTGHGPLLPVQNSTHSASSLTA